MRSLLAKIINSVKNDRFLRNSAIFFAGSFLASVGNYLYQLLMARMLTIENYGELQSLLAVSVIFAVPVSALSVVLVKYAAHFEAGKQLGKIRGLISFFTKRTLVAGAIIFSFFCIFGGHIAGFLNIDSVWPVIILGLSFLPSFLFSINNGIIQGLQKFKSASVIAMIDVFFKVVLGVLLVKLSFGLNGALGALVLSGLVGYLIAFLPLRFIFKEERSGIDTREIFRYFAPTFFTLLFIALLYNLDVVLVKHFLPAQIAGEYGALAVIGHIILFISGPVITVMFPMSAAAYAGQGDHARIFKKTFFLVSLIGAGVLFFYFIIPDFIIKILVGTKFLNISKFLGWFGISMLLCSLATLFSRYFLSIHKTRYFWPVGLGALLQVIFISVWHSSLWQIVWIMNISMSVVLGLLAWYYLKFTNTNKKCSQN